MPDFDKETFVGHLTNVAVKEGLFSPQIVGDIERLDDRPDRNIWIPIPYDRENNRDNPITKRTTLAQWVTAVVEVEPEVETLDFRAPHRAKALKRLCAILEGNYYSWENRNYSWATGDKDRLTPVEKYATEELAMAAVSGAEATGLGPSAPATATAGGLAVPDAWKGIEGEWIAAVQAIKEEFGGKPRAVITKALQSREGELLEEYAATPDDFLTWWDEV